MKKKSVAKLRQEAKAVFQRYIRLKESNENGYVRCVTCGKVGYWEGDGFDGGHFIPASKPATCFVEANVHVMCKGCNKFGMGAGNRDTLHTYTEWMEREYGYQFVKDLRDSRHKEVIRKRQDYEEIIDEYLDKIVGLSIQKGLV